jgi:GNAT superfamily N-acetyltransferase
MDREGRKAWQWMGFGLATVDAVRSLDPVPGGSGDTRIRRANLEDVEAAAQLNEALWRHLCAPPVFLLRKPRHWVEVQRAFVSDPANALWLAERDGQVVASMRHGPVSDDVCYVLRDGGTTGILGAYTRPEARSRGVAVALLNQVLAQAREQGYERCGVDFETQNIEGVRFWLRHFQPVSYGLARCVDGRARGSE